MNKNLHARAYQHYPYNQTDPLYWKIPQRSDE